MTILVTGATGLIGANIATQLMEKGKKVRTIVRDPKAEDAESLRKAGVEVVTGEISVKDDFLKAAKGVEGIIHSAAMLGRPGSSMTEGFSANAIGTIHAYTAAQLEGNIPMVEVITSTFFDMWDKPLSEKSPLDTKFSNTDAYSVTKRLAYVEGVVRAMEGQNIRFMLPGAAFGPSICLGKALEKNSFNGRFYTAIKGEMKEQLPIPMPFVFTPDCAAVAIAALERGTNGERYLAMGDNKEMKTLAAGLNIACEIAGSPHRLQEVAMSRMDDPDVIAKYGETMPMLCKRKYPKPFFDSSITEKKFGIKPTPYEEGVRITVDWLRKIKAI